MRNSDAYNLGYQMGQSLAFLFLVGFILGIYFLVKYLRKRGKRNRQNDTLDEI